MALKLHKPWLKVHLNRKCRMTSRPFSNREKGLLSFKDIPRSPQIPLLGSLPYFLKSGGQMQVYKYADNLHKKLGPLFVDKMIGTEMLFISDPEANLQVYRSEGPYPEHLVPDAWTEYLQETKRKRGLFFMDGPEWHKYRQILNRQLLHPRSMENQVQQVSTVCRDFISTWKNSPTCSNMEYRLYSWNIECVGTIALGKRLGFLNKLTEGNEIDAMTVKEEEEFSKCIHDTFLQTAHLYELPIKVAKLLRRTSWNRFCTAVTKSLDIGRRYVERGMHECRTSTSREIRWSILYKLLNEEHITEDMASVLLIDLFLASADTTSHTARWAFYLLGKNPEVARKTREELLTVLSQTDTLTLSDVNKCSYLKGIIKETLRLYPTASFLTRKLAQDTELKGYHVPAGMMVITSLYSMGRDPKHFTDPNSFRPERWFRGNKVGMANDSSNPNLCKMNKKAYVPWGFGGRSCVGKRIAELEISLLLMEALLAFDWTVDEDVEMLMRMVAVPSKDFELKLKPLSTVS